MRIAPFVRAVKRALKGEKPPKHLEWERRGVVAAINEVQLMEVYGGYEQLMNAPAAHVARTRLVLLGRSEYEREEYAESKAASASSEGPYGPSTATTTTTGTRTYTSRYRPPSPYDPLDEDEE